MTQNDVDVLVAALQAKFGAEVAYEAVNNAGRFRFSVTSPAFANMDHMARQDAIWAEVDRVLSTNTTLDISLILAYAPADFAAAN